MTEGAEPTRRAFVAGVARKAVYVVPAVMTLTAAQRAAADFTGCVGPTSPCTMNQQCCTGYQCLNAAMSLCTMGDTGCTCG